VREGGCPPDKLLAKTTVRIASAPTGEPVSADYEVRANGQAVPVYVARVAEVADGPPWTLPAGSFGGRYSFASFDASGPVEVEIGAPGRDLSRTVIRPSSCGVCARHEDGVLKLSLERPVRLSIEPDGRNVPLFLFVNPPEEQAPRPGSPSILYFGPGLHEPGENMPIEDVTVERVWVHAEGWRPAYDHEDDLDPQSRKWDFIALHPSVNFWMKDKVPGCIRRVVLRDIHLEGTNDARGYRLWIGGSSDRHSVQNVHLQNITAFGEPLRPEHPLVEIGPFTRNIHFSTTA
jgi:hypothetical protein